MFGSFKGYLEFCAHAKSTLTVLNRSEIYVTAKPISTLLRIWVSKYPLLIVATHVEHKITYSDDAKKCVRNDAQEKEGHFLFEKENRKKLLPSGLKLSTRCPGIPRGCRGPWRSHM